MAYDSENFIVSQSLPCAETGPNSPSSPLAPRLLDRDPKSLKTPRERLVFLRDFLRELPPERFDMGDSGDSEDAGTGSCGSPACIGGWSRALFGNPGAPWDCIATIGASVLDLRRDVAWALFYPDSEICLAPYRSAYTAQPAEAANVLDHLIRTGEVDWSVA